VALNTDILGDKPFAAFESGEVNSPLHRQTATRLVLYRKQKTENTKFQGTRSSLITPFLFINIARELK
jgi:hypothetical protein